MKKVLVVIFLSLVFISGYGLGLTKTNEYTVTRVIDGDTFVIDNNEKVRMIGIDTPETVHPNKPVESYGKEASNFTKELLTGKKVKLYFDVQERDKYGRLLAYVYLDKTFVNALLLKEGYARVMTIPPNVKYAEEFLELEREARKNNKGLWAY